MTGSHVVNLQGSLGHPSQNQSRYTHTTNSALYKINLIKCIVILYGQVMHRTHLTCLYNLFTGLSCPRVDKVINDTRNVFEHENFSVIASILSDSTFSYLQWCFKGSNNQRNCCICDNNAGGLSRNCSQEDWHLQTTFGEECSYKITCTLTVKNIEMKYNEGVFISEAIVPLQSKTIVASEINVKVIHKDHEDYLFYIISGSGALVGVIVIVIISYRIVSMAKAQRKSLTRSYLSMNSSLPLSYPGI